MRKTNRLLMTGALWACWTVSGFAQEPKMLAQIPSTDRVIHYHLHDIPALHIAIRYVTVLSLPEGEKIAGIFLGDKDNWTVEHAESIVTIKAGGPGVQSNLNVVAESGNSYNFMLDEVSRDPHQQVYLSIRIVNEDADRKAATKDRPQFGSYEEIEKAKRETAEAQAALQREKAARQMEAKRDLEAAQLAAADGISHEFTWKGNKQSKSFGLRSIYTLNGFTYFDAHPQEAFAIYEKKDNADSLIQYSMSPDGKYVVPKELDRGYLKVGRCRIEFRRRAGNG